MNIHTKKIAIFSFAFLTPVFSFANSVDLSYLEDAVISVGNLVSDLIPIAIALGLLFFIWGIVQFIASAGDEGAKEVGKRRMVWGIIALFVIVAAWGLVGLLAELSGVELGGTVDTPSVPL